MNNFKAFTLVELLVWVTISMLLMISVGVFVSTWMSNIILQKKVIDDNKKLSSDVLYLNKILWNSNKYISETSSWVLVRKNKYFDTWWYSYLWLKKIDKQYCWTWEITETNHIFISNFIPYEEIWEDINSNFWNILESNELNISWDIYKSDVLEHKILKKNWWNWDILIWRDIFWDWFTQGSIWTWVFLNSPTGLTEIDWNLVFSDTLNNRILYLSGWLVYKLLDGKDWLNEPTWLAYDSSWKRLFISNSWSWEILEFSSKAYTQNPQLDILFKPDQNFSNINKLELVIDETNKNFSWPNYYSDFTFSQNIRSVDDYIELENNKIKYYFIWSYINNITRSECSWKNNWDIILNYPSNSIKCTNSSGSWAIANFRNINFNNWTDYNISINSGKITPLLEDSRHFYSELNLFNWNTSQHIENFPYYTKWDDDIFTLDDNTLKVIKSWLKYPTGLFYNSLQDSLYINIFEDRKQKKLNLSSLNILDNSNLTNFSSNNFEQYNISFIFSNPVEKLDIEYNIPNKFLNLKLDYYKYFNCFNIDDKIKRSLLFKNSYK